MNTVTFSTAQTNRVKLKPYSLSELAGIYGVCNRTLKRWMKPFEEEIGERDGRFYQIPQVKVIFERLMVPEVE